MAGYPPPYPPNGAPFGPGWQQDPRQQRVAAKQMRIETRAQIKAQRDAFRNQRMLYKQQARALRRTSILGPLLVIGIGVVLLLIRLGNIPFAEFAAYYGRWWPFLFIAAGLVLVLEWAFDQYSHHEGMPFSRRGVGGGVVFLLILLAITGAAIQTFHVNHAFILDGLHLDADNLGQFFGERHEFEQELDQPFSAGTSLSIDNPRGDVTVVGKSDDDKVHIVVNKQIYYIGNQSDSIADRLNPRVSLSGGTLFVSIPQLENASADLSITVPDFGQTTINAGHGAVNVSDLRAPLNVTAGHGDVELNHITGAVIARINSGASFSAHTIAGDVQFKGHADDLNLTNISGRVTLEGEFYGDTHLEALGGPVSFRTSRTEFSFARLDGMVDVSSDEELTGSQLVGPTELHTRSRNISLERVAGQLDIVDSNGTVDVTSSAPLGNLSVINSDGAVTLTVPSGSGATVEASTRDGGIEDELLHTSVASAPNASDDGSTGDGSAHLKIHTTHADITIHQGFVEPPALPALPGSPAAPAPPPTPEKASKPKHHAAPATPTAPAAPAEPPRLPEA